MALSAGNIRLVNVPEIGSPCAAAIKIMTKRKQRRINKTRDRTVDKSHHAHLTPTFAYPLWRKAASLII